MSSVDAFDTKQGHSSSENSSSGKDYQVSRILNFLNRKRSGIRVSSRESRLIEMHDDPLTACSASMENFMR